MFIKAAALTMAAIYGLIGLFLDNNEVGLHWPIYKDRNVKIYAQPDKESTIYHPNNVCTGQHDQNNKLFLLILVHSAPTGFERRDSIRNTWGCYLKYLIISDNIKRARLITSEFMTNDTSLNETLKKNPKPKFVGVKYETCECENDSVLKDIIPEYRIVFVIGLSTSRNKYDIEQKIDEEVETHGDILQENFEDSYQTLSIKSVMMLKWVTRHCNNSVRYILKTDDDMFVNVADVMIELKRKSEAFDTKVANGHKEPEYSLMGQFSCGRTPELDKRHKWYTPSHMFKGKTFPCFIHGMGYIMSYAAAVALYEAALKTPLFHIEDVYITGFCRQAATPPFKAKNTTRLTYESECRWTSLSEVCLPLVTTFCHEVLPHAMLLMTEFMLQPGNVEWCEREFPHSPW